MSDTSKTEKKSNHKVKILLILITLISIGAGAGAGGTWFYMQGQSAGENEYEPPQPNEIPSAFKELDIFTVNLQPEERSQYLQVGLTVKIRDTDVVKVIDKQMPEIRNRILLLLTSKSATDLSTLIGKQQLSSELVNEIRKSLNSERMREDIVDVLFTSFVIQ